MLWARAADGSIVHAEELNGRYQPGDPHPAGFVCPSDPCGVPLSWYREHTRADVMIPAHFQLTTAGSGRIARHAEGCEVEDGSWIAPDGDLQPPAPKPRETDPEPTGERYRLSLRTGVSTPHAQVARPAQDAAAPAPRAAVSPVSVPGRAQPQRLTSAAAVGRRHLAVRADADGHAAAMLFGSREVPWSDVVYEPHRYGELARRIETFGNPAHKLALVVRPVALTQHEDGLWRLACAPFWFRPSDDLAGPMLYAQRRETFGEVEDGRLYVVLADLTARTYDHDTAGGTARRTYFFASLDDAVEFGASETAEEYAAFHLGERDVDGEASESPARS